jgi:hypothetical protein
MATDKEMADLRDLFAWHSEQVKELEGVEGEEANLAFHQEATSRLLFAIMTIRPKA